MFADQNNHTQVRAQMLQGCEVVPKIVLALEHALNREPMGGQYNSLRKVIMSFNELCKSDSHKVCGIS